MNKMAWYKLILYSVEITAVSTYRFRVKQTIAQSSKEILCSFIKEQKSGYCRDMLLSHKGKIQSIYMAYIWYSVFHMRKEGK